jgi:nitrate/nitrite transporter NarK
VPANIAVLFFPRSRKINIWASFIILSPYFGPLFAAFIITTQKWEWPFWVYTIETGLCLVAMVLFMDETYYNRTLGPDQRPKRKSRLMRLVGVEQFKSRKQRSTFRQAFMRPVKVLMKPTVFLSCLYYIFTFAWVVGINTTLAIFVTPLYNFGPLQIGMLFHPFLFKCGRPSLTTARLLLLHPHRRRHPRRDRRALAP